jgi:hypothetical protein
LSCSIDFIFQGTLSLHQVKVRGRDSALSFGCGFAAENATRGVVMMKFGASDALGALAVHINFGGRRHAYEGDREIIHNACQSGAGIAEAKVRVGFILVRGMRCPRGEIRDRK